MRTFLFLFFTSFFIFTPNNVFSQNAKIEIDADKTISVAKIFELVQEQAGYKFIYSDDLIANAPEVKLKKGTILGNELIQKGLSPIDCTFEFTENETVIVKRNTNSFLGESNDNQNLQLTITGNVLDENGGPLPGASIIEKGTTNGVTTDFDGNFSIQISGADAVLSISYIGYKTKEVIVGSQTQISVQLESDSAKLDEVVIIGYGSVKKSDVTGAMSSLKEEDFNVGANASADQLLQGKVSGVQINQSSGEPGGGLSVRIRGSSSINATNQPLYVIDGFAIDNGNTLGIGGSASLGDNPNVKNPLNTLNVSDIASIEILKDASATAIYGSRAANGVILITTKKGKKGKVSVNYDTYIGVQSIANKIDVLTAPEYMDVMNGISVDGGGSAIFSSSDISDIGNGTDWQDEIFRDAFVQNHNWSVQGGSEKTSYFTSLNYFDQEGIVKNTGIKKYIARLNLSQQVGEKFNVQLNLTTSQIKDLPSKDGVNNNEVSGPVNSSMLYDPTSPVFNDDGTYFRSTDLTINNPLSVIFGINGQVVTNRTMGNISLNYDLTDNLSTKINFGSDRQNVRSDVYTSTETIRGASQGGVASINTLELSNELLEYTLTYDGEVNENNTFNLLGGVTYQNFNRRIFGGNISGFPSDEIGTDNLGLGNNELDGLNSFRSKSSLLSYLGRANYSLYDKLLLTATFRADGSSKFGENNKYGYFPSFAAAWKLTDESFVPSSFNELKLRASWGQTGNEGIDIGQSQQSFSPAGNATFNDGPFTAVRPSRIANPDLKWETTEQFNVGVDFGMFKNRVSGSIDYYTKNTIDMLINLPLPTSSGFGSVLRNIGEIKNSGLEFFVKSTIVSTDDFQWSTSINLSTLQNEVSDIGDLEVISSGDIEALESTTIIKPGLPLNSYFGYEITGLFQTQGEIDASAQPSARLGYPIFKDLNGDGNINPDDRVVLGDPFPDFIYGIQNSLTYKDFTFDFFIQGQNGSELLNVNAVESMYPLNFRRNKIAEQGLDRWTPQNTDTKWPSGVVPSAYGGGKVNSLTVEDATYLRLKSVRLNYNVPVDNIGFIQSLNMNITGQNLFTITDYSGWDPEANSFGSGNVSADISSYPTSKTVLFGLSATF